MNIDKQVNSIVEAIISDIQEQAKARVLDIVQKQILAEVAQINFRALFDSAFTASLKNQSFTFPDGSIPAEAIVTGNLQISGNNVSGGIITNFGSTGIDDKATNCQLTILDEVTVVENNLLTKDLTVKGTATIEGDLHVTGTVPESSPFYQKIVASATHNVRSGLDQTLFQGYADAVFEQIKRDGIDIPKLSVNGQDIVDGGSLSSNITSSSLQKLGQLKELQVQGESLLSGSLYTTTQRVGINTVEPSQVLSIWDQEIEVGIGKRSSNTAVIETPRPHTLILSSNNKNNIKLTPDGATSVNQLNIGSMSFTVSDRPPSTDMPKGSVVFNNNPNLGGPMGWVSLGDAKWANFGIID